MSIEIIAVILFVSLIALTVNRFMPTQDSRISFKETLDLTGLPIITFQAGGSKLNFLLDSGSTDSHISPEASNLIGGYIRDIDGYECTTASSSITGSVKCIDTTLEYNGNSYDASLIVNPSLTQAFADIKSSKGANIHGILGSDFFNKCNYVLDFRDYIAYSKKLQK